MAHVNGTHVKGIANATDLERIAFDIGGTSYEIAIFKDPPAKVWNDLKTIKPGETPFDQDTRVLERTVQDWDLGLEISKAAIEDLREPVRQAMVFSSGGPTSWSPCSFSVFSACFFSVVRALSTMATPSR